MGFHIIAGTFHVRGYSPDGDSIRFKARDERNWRLLNGPRVTLNAQRHAQLRLEAIDTLETHIRHQPHHQPLGLAMRATDYLLSSLSITDVQTNELRTRVTDAVDESPGYIVSREIERNRRPVSFVFAGEPPKPDGSSVFLDVAWLQESVNYQSVANGFAYPTYYKGLFSDLRDGISNAAQSARDGELGVWAEDVTNDGFDVPDLASLSDQHVILPKLFRRLAEYLHAGGPVSGFKEFLENRAEEIIIIDRTHATHFDTVVEVNGSHVRLTEPPENLVFVG